MLTISTVPAAEISQMKRIIEAIQIFLYRNFLGVIADDYLKWISHIVVTFVKTCNVC
jgi:hypothetical protein